MSLGNLPTVLVSIGGAAVMLGIGFSIAATALRDALTRARREMRENASAPIQEAVA